MELLLDTHALLYWLFDDRRLSKTARHVIADPDNTVFVSSASAWEIATKHRLGKLPGTDALVADMEGWIAKARFHAMPITIAHAQRAGSLTIAHRDPFDRMLAAQSAIEDVPMVSADAVMRAIGVRVIW